MNGPGTDSLALQQRYAAALDDLVAVVREDRSILAAILCGSLSHDVVWERSDIDLVLVTVDDRKVPCGDRAIVTNGVNVHAWLMPRTTFRQAVDGIQQHSFVHSLLAKGRLLYTHDETIAALCRRLTDLGARDRDVQLLRAASHALGPLDKAHKWLVTRGDLDYAALWILYAATPFAQIEVLSAGRLLDREVLPQALAINPAFFTTIYTALLNTLKTRAAVEAALAAMDDYLARQAPRLFAPILSYLDEVGDVRSCADIDDHFRRQLNVSGLTPACEYLADRGLIGKASASVRLTKKSTVDVEELAFYSLAAPTDR